MTANDDLQRRLKNHYHGEPPMRAPEWVLQSALSTIETTQQRRGLAALRRYPNMSTYTKLAAAAVAVLAVGGLALWQLAPQPDTGTPSGPPTTAGVPTAQPTTAPTEPGPTTYVPGALTQTFTSDVHGVSLNYPEGWAAQAATRPWTEVGTLWSDPSLDKVHDDASLQDHLFLSVASAPLNGASLEAWFSGIFGDDCTLTADGTIDGADRVLVSTPSTRCVNDLALASAGGRGYVFELRASDDDVELRTLDTAALLDAILATVQLLPEDAVDE